jgi:hypothetical protein
MSRPSRRDPEKEQFWRAVFADWEPTGLSGAAYCRQHELSYVQFKSWQKKFRKRDAAAVLSQGSTRRRAQPGELASPRDVSDSVEFAEVKLRDSDKQLPAKEGPAAIEILLRSGTQLRIAHHCRPELLEAVLAVLEVR